MENICHTMVGGVLARAGCDRLSPLAMPTMLIAANMPDVDIISGWWGELAYLEHHRGVTHSLVGLAVQAPLLAGGMVLLDRLVRRRADDDRPRARFWGLVVVALVGLASHVLLDWTNSYGVRPWLPFDGSWSYGDIVFVVDPWLWLLVGGALFLGAARRWLTVSSWCVLYGSMAFVVVAQQRAGQSDSGGAVAMWLWLALLAALLAVRLVAKSLSAQRLAVGSLVLLAGYWVAMFALHGAAERTVANVPSGSAVDRARFAAIPTLMRPDRWTVLRATDSEIEMNTVLLGSGATVSNRSIPRRLDDAAVASALQSCPGQVAAGFNRFLYAEIEPRAESSEQTVLLRDARFGGIPGRYGFATTPVTVDAALRYVPDGRPCPRSSVAW